MIEIKEAIKLVEQLKDETPTAPKLTKEDIIPLLKELQAYRDTHYTPNEIKQKIPEWSITNDKFWSILICPECGEEFTVPGLRNEISKYNFCPTCATRVYKPNM